MVNILLQSETTSSITKLCIENSNRNDSGKYTITAKNEFGKDSADIEVVVVSKPGVPRGPLTYDGITQDSVSLSWHPPTDDGGSDITGKVILFVFISDLNKIKYHFYC